MEDFIVSARKYRPQTFETVVGQDSITNTLENAIKNNHLAHAFLFCGPRGVGKTTCARILAKTINKHFTPNVDENEDFSFNIFELDAASNNSVDDIRSLIDQVRFAPQIGKYKVYIIDEVHMLSQAAFNAFLKTLEEPPAHAIFILATTEKHKILPTILSRCQIFDFNRISIADMSNHLAKIATKENIDADKDALHIIAQKADGSLRDALSIFDQIVTFAGSKITYKTVIDNLNILDYDYYFKVAECIRNQQIPEMLLIFDEIINNGFDGHNFINGLASHLRNLMVSKTPATIKLLEVGESIGEKYKVQAQQFGMDLLLQSLKILSSADINYRASKNQRLLVELSLMQLCSIMGEEKKNDSREIIFKSAIKTTSAESKIKDENAILATKSIVALPIIDIKSVHEKVEESIIEDVNTQSLLEPEKQFALTTGATDAMVEKNLVAEPVLPKQGYVSKLGGLKLTSSVSINSNLKQNSNSFAEVELFESEQELPEIKNGFDQEKLNTVWRNYCAMVKAKEKQSLYATLNKRLPKLSDGFIIDLPLDNDVQFSDVRNEKPELLKYLREQLNNNKITLNATVEDLQDDVRLYTPEEKFKAMKEKNPVLINLYKKFDLEV
jgi:DNA polymerase III subunit gamma/tau